MSQTRSGTFLSIGDVVKSLSQEFPEISVSKVRFFETEGLIDPERTPSGYRKFTPSDVARLKYILRLQRDQFMPLKVIRQRLEHFDPAEAEEPQTPGGPRSAAPVENPDEEVLAMGLQLSFEELVNSSGCDADTLRALEEYGLIESHPSEEGVVYDEDDLMVAKIARDYGKYGVQPRHLKMYRNFAEREAGFFDQIFLPISRSGDNGKRQAAQSLNELIKLSRRLKHILLRNALREHLHG